MNDRVNVEKKLIPYSFSISLSGDIYELEFRYNQKHDFFTVKLSKDGEVVCEGEPLVYGKTLFSDFFDAKKHPGIDIVPFDESGHQDTVTFENFGETVFLNVDNGVNALVR